MKSLRSPRHLVLLDRLRTLRKEAGVTQVELAARLGRPQSYVAKIEGGERRMDVLEFIDWFDAIGAGEQIGSVLRLLAEVRPQSTRN